MENKTVTTSTAQIIKEMEILMNSFSNSIGNATKDK